MLSHVLNNKKDRFVIAKGGMDGMKLSRGKIEKGYRGERGE